MQEKSWLETVLDESIDRIQNRPKIKVANQSSNQDFANNSLYEDYVYLPNGEDGYDYKHE